jgi:hypothetical protein
MAQPDVVVRSTRPQPADQLRWVELQRFREPNEITYGNVAPSLLEGADIRAMKIRAISKFLL